MPALLAMPYCLVGESNAAGSAPGSFKPTYTPQGVARVFGWPVSYAKRYLKRMENDGHAVPAGDGSYVLTKRGQLELISELYDEMKKSDFLNDPILGIDPPRSISQGGLCHAHDRIDESPSLSTRIPYNLAYKALERLEKMGKIKKIRIPKSKKGKYKA